MYHPTPPAPYLHFHLTSTAVPDGQAEDEAIKEQKKERWTTAVQAADKTTIRASLLNNLLDATGPVEDPDQSSKIPLSLLHLLLTGETAHEGSTATQKSSLPKQIIEQHRLQTHKTLPNN